MKASHILVAGAAALLGVSTSSADIVIHITGSTAFRAATVNGIVAILGGTSNVATAYRSTGSGSGANITASNQAIIRGTPANATLAAATGVVTVKCSWSGSVGGIKTLVQNLDTATWMSRTHLGAVNTSTAVTEATISYALDTATFPTETPKADVTMADNSQSATGFNTVALTGTQVGVIAFEWVVGNSSAFGAGTPATAVPIDNITPFLAQAVISGGAPLSQFTHNGGDVGTPVYAVGRDFDSGTRLSCLAETGVGIFGSVQHIQPVFTGTAGAADGKITQIKLWQAESVLNQAFAIGNSGYNSGGSLADALATPGAPTSTTADGGATIPLAQQVGFGPGHLIGYLGRSDATRACKTTTIPGNNAHRVKFNGVADWVGPILASGAPTSFDDTVVQEGLYQCWEYEYLSYRSSFGTTNAPGKSFADALATQIIGVNATDSGIKLSTMNVGKAVEGGVITHL